MSKIINLNKKIINQEITSQKLISQTLKTLESNKTLNAYINIVNKYSNNKNNKTSLLNGIPYAIKDNINVQNTITTGGSLFFKDYISPYDAYVVELLNQAGAIPVAKANLDEFGLGGTGTFSGFGHVVNPFFKERITSGSSSGSAVLVANDTVPFALGTDTGDSIRKPASYLGIIGYKPSYGYISRFGVFPYSPSLDHVGILTKSVTDVAIVADCICKHDEQDFTSQIQEKHNFYKSLNDPIKGIVKMCYLENILDFMPSENKNIFLNSIKKIEGNKIKIRPINFPVELIQAIAPVYKIISYSEAVSCYQNITGIPFGQKNIKQSFQETISSTRSKYFGKELKRRFVFGSYCTLVENYDDLFVSSKKIRRLIVEKAKEIFKEYDFVIMPGSSTWAPTKIDVETKKYNDTLIDDYLQIANFSGYPSITLPMYKNNNNFIGINLMGYMNNDKQLLTIAKHVNYILNNGD